MRQTMMFVAVLLGVALLPVSTGYAQPSPFNATANAIDSQQQYQSQPQRLSPRNQLFMSPGGQPQSYDAITINRYLMGSPGSDYRVRPIVKSPMYQIPGQ